MPRVRNVETGAVVSVSDDVAAALGAEWKPVSAKTTSKSGSKPSPGDESPSSGSTKG